MKTRHQAGRGGMVISIKKPIQECVGRQEQRTRRKPHGSSIAKCINRHMPPSAKEQTPNQNDGREIERTCQCSKKVPGRLVVDREQPVIEPLTELWPPAKCKPNVRHEGVIEQHPRPRQRDRPGKTPPGERGGHASEELTPPHRVPLALKQADEVCAKNKYCCQKAKDDLLCIHSVRRVQRAMRLDQELSHAGPVRSTAKAELKQPIPAYDRRFPREKSRR